MRLGGHAARKWIDTWGFEHPSRKLMRQANKRNRKFDREAMWWFLRPDFDRGDYRATWAKTQRAKREANTAEG